MWCEQYQKREYLRATTGGVTRNNCVEPCVLFNDSTCDVSFPRLPRSHPSWLMQKLRRRSVFASCCADQECQESVGVIWLMKKRKRKLECSLWNSCSWGKRKLSLLQPTHKTSNWNVFGIIEENEIASWTLLKPSNCLSVLREIKIFPKSTMAKWRNDASTSDIKQTMSNSSSPLVTSKVEVEESEWDAEANFSNQA